MGTPLITLDSRGLVEDPNQKIERILTYLLSTEASQSNVHRAQLISIPDIMRKYGSDHIEIKNAIQTALEECFRGYFTNTLVDVVVTLSTDNDSMLIVSIRAKVEQNNKWHDVAKALTATNDTIKLVSEFDVR